MIVPGLGLTINPPEGSGGRELNHPKATRWERWYARLRPGGKANEAVVESSGGGREKGAVKGLSVCGAARDVAMCGEIGSGCSEVRGDRSRSAQQVATRKPVDR